MDCDFCIKKINIGLNLSHKDVLLYFLPDILLLGFRFYFFTSHFHLIFVYDAKYRFKFIVFMWIYSCFKTIWWKGDPFSTALPLHLCQKSAVYIFVGLLLDSVLFHRFICVSVLYCFDYCSFILILEIRQYKFSDFVLLQSCFGYSRLFAFLCEF